MYRINLIDTPGHADFGGEVERVLNMASGTLLLVDAYEGPMPQTRFVLQKSLERGLQPILVVNKIDRPDARPQEVVDEVFDLLVDLDAPDDVLDFQIIFASARQGWATIDLERAEREAHAAVRSDRQARPGARRRRDGEAAAAVPGDHARLLRVRRPHRHRPRACRDDLEAAARRGDRPPGRGDSQEVVQLLAFEGLERVEVDEVVAGDLCAVVGLEPIEIGDTVADADQPHALPHARVDEPTLHMMFRVNDGPFCGRDGKFVTSRQIGERLERELRSNVALRVGPGPTQEQFRVSGRGMMHLGILIENMRREGFELCVGKPQVIYREIDGVKCEPIEQLVVDCPEDCQSSVMALLGDRRAEMVKMGHRSVDQRIHPHGVPHPGPLADGPAQPHAQRHQGPGDHASHAARATSRSKGELPKRPLGVLISNESGSATAYSLDALYDRGVFFVRPGEEVYQGQVVGENCRAGDLVVNVVRGKQLTNVRASGKDENAKVRPVREMSLEAVPRIHRGRRAGGDHAVQGSACARSCSWNPTAAALPTAPRAETSPTIIVTQPDCGHARQWSTGGVSPLDPR